MFLSFYNPYTSPDNILHAIFLTFNVSRQFRRLQSSAKQGERRKLANEQAREHITIGPSNKHTVRSLKRGTQE
jgi:hypothetical protein